MKLNKIILQLKQQDYNTLFEQLKQNKADKFLSLLSSYREDKLTEKEIQAELGIKSAAFYTLKSRLYDKIQEFLYSSTQDNRVELLQNIANIEHLIYKTPREIANGILLKLEAELEKNDMPNELIAVYKAFKKLHVNSPKYYDYLQNYNKYVAFNLAQDKAEELLSSFCRSLCEYYNSRDPQLLEILSRYKKEMQHVCKLYESHRLKVYRNILNIHFALFSPISEEVENDDSIEEMLKQTYSIIEKNTEDRSYLHLISVVDFLSFEYYHQLKLNKNAAIYYDKTADEFGSILLFNHSCFSIHFLISKIEWSIKNNATALLNENEELIYEPVAESIDEYIVYNQYKAGLFFYKEKNTEAIQTLNKLINEVSFKNRLHSEVETKLFLIFLLLLNEKQDQAEVLLRSISRKIADENDEIRYHSALLYLKLFKTALANKSAGKLQKLTEISQLMTAVNTGVYQVIPYIVINKTHLTILAR